jgi:hypothetical protein
VFLSGTSCKSLIHKLGCWKPRTTCELVDIATNHASSEEAVGAVSLMVGPKARPSGRTMMRAPPQGRGKRKKKNRRRANPNMVTAADHAGKRQGNADHFEQLLDKPCTNHGYPIKHKLKDCELLKRMLGQLSKRKGGDRDKKALKDQGVAPKDGSGFPDLDGYLMMFGGLKDDCTKHQHKVRHRDACAAGNAVPKFLHWSSTPITSDQGEHSPNIPRPGSYPLAVDPIIGNNCLTKVLMGGGSSLNILYVETLDVMGISQSKLRASIFSFLGIIPGMRECPLGNIDLPVMFGDHSNFRTETMIFEVVDWRIVPVTPGFKVKTECITTCMLGSSSIHIVTSSMNNQQQYHEKRTKRL